MPPFATVFDPAVPTDASPASSGDDELRGIKAGIIERMNTIVENFESGTVVDSATVLKLKDEVFPEDITFRTGAALTDRPNPPERAELLFYIKDTDQLFYSVVDGATFKWEEAKKREEDIEIASLAISAGESRFKINTTDSNATRVKNAINTAKLSSAPVRVIYIPKDMWGYVGDSDYDSNMYDPSILLVREGSMVSWYDPVAYGADISGSANSRAAILVCYAHAATTNIGIKMVAFTVPGDYLLTGTVDQNGVPLFMGTGAAIIGGGTLTGTRPFRIPADTVPQIDFASSYTVGGSAATTVTIARRLYLLVRGTATGTELVVNWAAAGLATDYPLANLHTINAVQVERIGVTGADKGSFGLSVDATAGTITFGDLASGTSTEFDLILTFIP